MKAEKPYKALLASAVAFGVIIIVVCLAYLSQKEFRETMVSQSQQQLLAIANTTARSVEEFMAMHSEELLAAAKEVLSPAGSVRDGQTNRYSPLQAFYESHKNEIDTIRLLDRTGTLISRYPVHGKGLETTGVSLAGRPEVAYVLRKHKPHSMETVRDKPGGSSVTISEPVFSDGTFFGIVQRTVSLETVSNRFVLPVKLHGEGCAWMFDDNNIIVSHPRKEFVGVSVLDLIIDMHLERGETFDEEALLEHIQKDHGYLRQAKVQHEGYGVFVDCTTHKDELVAYRRVSLGDINWYLVATLPYHEIAGPINKHGRNIFGLAGFIVLLFGVGGAFFFKTQKRRAELETEAKYLKEIAKSAEALRESERRLRDLVENSLTGIFIVQDNRIVYKNPEQERLFGPLPEAFGFSDFKNIHPDDVETFRHFYETVFSGDVQALDAEIRFYPVDKLGSRVDLRWAHCRANLIQYQGKNAVLINMMDMTRAKELERLVLMKQKMVSLGHVAAGMAHEIRNPLSGINIYVTNLKRIIEGASGLEKEDLQKSKKIVKQLRSASEKIEAVIRRVMDFSKPSQPKFSLIDVNASVEEAINLSSVTLRKKGIALEKSLDRELPPCYADHHLIEQVILNLVTNAAQALEEKEGKKKIAIATSGENNHVVVTVSDTGPGVRSDVEDKIFEPFFTTKSDSSGIGLSISHRIATDHGGALEVTTSRWGGAEFILRVPENNKE